ncbi:MAG: hypothetical protein H0Z34_00725 [Brevibacillus sp.]|nr:hypothetical protein [Brevibacillus sp.]
MPTKSREHEWGVFRAHVRWPTSEEADQDRSTTIRRGSGKTRSRCRRDAVAAAISLRIRRFAGRLAKPFAGEKRPALVPCESFGIRPAPYDALFVPRQRVLTGERPFSE